MTYENDLKEIFKLPSGIQQLTLGALLTRLFSKKNISLVIVGGAAVQFYTQADYVTKDLDAILGGDDPKTIDEIMHSLGFKRTTTYRHFEHPLLNFVIEFPPSPVEIGNRTISVLSKINTSQGPVKIVRLEDILMDRIIASVEWKSEIHLAQAKLLWIKNRKWIDKTYLRQFAKEEGYEKELKKVMNTSIIGTKYRKKRKG